VKSALRPGAREKLVGEFVGLDRGLLEDRDVEPRDLVHAVFEALVVEVEALEREHELVERGDLRDAGRRCRTMRERGARPRIRGGRRASPRRRRHQHERKRVARLHLDQRRRQRTRLRSLRMRERGGDEDSDRRGAHLSSMTRATCR
jgi:hypothetical protein